jgi:hypothetical protein
MAAIRRCSFCFMANHNIRNCTNQTKIDDLDRFLRDKYRLTITNSFPVNLQYCNNIHVLKRLGMKYGLAQHLTLEVYTSRLHDIYKAFASRENETRSNRRRIFPESFFQNLPPALSTPSRQVPASQSPPSPSLPPRSLPPRSPSPPSTPPSRNQPRSPPPRVIRLAVPQLMQENIENLRQMHFMFEENIHLVENEIQRRLEEDFWGDVNSPRRMDDPIVLEELIINQLWQDVNHPMDHPIRIDDPMILEELMPIVEPVINTGSILIITKEETDPLISTFNTDCPICYETLVPDSMIITNCHHSYCSTCICTCLKNTNKKDCPVCRSIIHTLIVNNPAQSDYILNF